ncbi:putative Xaa-Pro aminopeptidase [Gossypium arboreum]|uniref:Putative Xaa-Pro aminopeptidase n=1 Tax=Gossypium arboreum TaxID=29729 RepID=A0A0B0NJF0_GOSAR|nr:putative Xaa-Pro aminopeptidase [Gossypium arboreum]
MLPSTSSSSAAAAADMIKARTYNVLLNFRVEDTRNGSANDEDLRRGDEISRGIKQMRPSLDSAHLFARGIGLNAFVVR